LKVFNIRTLRDLLREEVSLGPVPMFAADVPTTQVQASVPLEATNQEVTTRPFIWVTAGVGAIFLFAVLLGFRKWKKS